MKLNIKGSYATLVEILDADEMAIRQMIDGEQRSIYLNPSQAREISQWLKDHLKRGEFEGGVE